MSWKWKPEIFKWRSNIWSLYGWSLRSISYQHLSCDSTKTLHTHPFLLKSEDKLDSSSILYRFFVVVAFYTNEDHTI